MKAADCPHLRVRLAQDGSPALLECVDCGIRWFSFVQWTVTTSSNNTTDPRQWTSMRPEPPIAVHVGDRIDRRPLKTPSWNDPRFDSFPPHDGEHEPEAQD